VAASGCGRSESKPPPPRLVLLYATCTLNRNYLGPYNPEVSFTPALDAFAAEGTVFSRHQTESGQSGVAYASLLSGTQSDRHGVYRHPSNLTDKAYLIAEAFSEHGYETHFWSGHYMAAAALDYGQGVEAENVHFHPQEKFEAERVSANDEEFAALLDRMEKDPSLRVFVQVLFTVTHKPYTDLDLKPLGDFRRRHPDEWPDIPEDDLQRAKRRYRRQWPRLERDFPALVAERGWTSDDVQDLVATLDAHYKASVWYLDSLFGRIVESIRDAGLLDESLIAITADHGETLWRAHTPFKWTHGFQLSPDVLQVPMIVRLPGRRGLPVYPAVSRSIDVHPTLLGLAGLPLEKGDDRIEGVDLTSAVLGHAPAPNLRAFSHTMPLNEKRVDWYRGWLISRFFPSSDVRLIWTAVREGDTFVRRVRSEDGDWATEVFDLDRDPAAERNVFDRDDDLHRELEDELVAYKQRLVEQHDLLRGTLLPEEEVAERLRAMGYIQ
jgi:arylsulfatase A-like enzyme